jgi:hypothetical protein
LRDIVITEFGIADLRGQSDENTVRQMLAVMHPHFRSEIVDAAWRANKIDTPTVKADERAAAGHEALLAAARRDGFFPTFPFGSDFNDDELAAAKALQQLQGARSMRGLLRIVSACLRAPADHGSANAVLNVLGLQDARGIRERIWRRVIAGMLRATQ